MSASNALPDTRSAEDILWRSREVVDPVLRTAVEKLPGSMRRVVGYHLGWWDADGTIVGGGSGKSVRAALALLVDRAAGGVADAAVVAAAAVEMVHSSTLLHDDIIDRDVTRRHRATAWRVFGISDALLAGDALLAQACGLVANSKEASRRLSRCVVELCDGQSADVAFERRGHATTVECATIAMRKTGALMGCACALGALSADAEPEVVEHFDAFGRVLGLVFQLVDDELGIWGDPAVTGKPRFSDLTRGKKSFPVAAALAADNDAGREFARLYTAGPPVDEEHAAPLADLITASGARRWVADHVEHHLFEAVDALQRAVPQPDDRNDLITLARFLGSRDR